MRLLGLMPVVTQELEDGVRPAMEAVNTHARARNSELTSVESMLDDDTILPCQIVKPGDGYVRVTATRVDTHLAGTLLGKANDDVQLLLVISTTIFTLHAHKVAAANSIGLT